jgi:hypothetical protein
VARIVAVFFSRIAALLEIDDLCIERGIARTQSFIQATLFGNGRAQLKGLAITVVRKPELGLQTEPGNRQYDNQPA